MDLESYCLIMTAQGLDPNERRDGKRKALTQSEIAFRKDLVSGKMVWTGNLWTDFWYYFISENAIFSLFCCPPYFGIPQQHPFSRSERICVLVIGLCWAFLWSSFSIYKDKSDEEEGHESTATEDAVYQGFDIIFGLCVSIICGISVRLATCSCVQGSTTRTRTWCERVGCFFNTINLILALIVLLMGIVGAPSGTINLLFLGMFKSNLYSWFGWDVLFCCIKFFIGWIGCGGLQKNYFKEKKIDRIDGKLCIHWKDYAYYIDPKTKGDSQYLTVQQTGTTPTPSTVEVPVRTIVIQQPVQTLSIQQQQPVQQSLAYHIASGQNK